MLIGYSGFRTLFFIIPRLPGFSLMTFPSKSPNSQPAVKVRNPWIIPVHLPAWSSLSSTVQPNSFSLQNHAPGSQNMLTHHILSALPLHHKQWRQPNLTPMPNRATHIWLHLSTPPGQDSSGQSYLGLWRGPKSQSSWLQAVQK